MPDVPRNCFLVWCPDRAYPTHAHPSIGLAYKEANRLAAANPGVEFFVMGKRASVLIPLPQTDPTRAIDRAVATTDAPPEGASLA